MKRRSLRGQVLLASVLWTVGLLFISSVPMTLLMEHFPRFNIVRHVHRFLQSPLLILLASLCMVAALMLGRRSLASVDALRGSMSGVHAGHARRIEGEFPSEVQPLVDDLNGLLEHRERAVRRAIAKAGDLAHGLKTPLALLTQEADRAAAAGQLAIGASIAQHVERMRRQVDYHLAQARAAASGVSGGAHSVARDAADGLCRALDRLYAERRLAISVTVPPDLSVKVQREDLDEMLGNLMDNACKWAASTVVVGAADTESPMVTITVDDDGPGLAAALRDAVLQRGVRADEAAPGSGLGLAIVRDLAELYLGSIVLGESHLGGLRASLQLPRA